MMEAESRCGDEGAYRTRATGEKGAAEETSSAHSQRASLPSPPRGSDSRLPPSQERSWPQLVGLSGGSDPKEFPCSAGDLGSIHGLGRFPGGGHGNPLQYSCLENPIDRGAWQATVHGVANSPVGLSN